MKIQSSYILIDHANDVLKKDKQGNYQLDLNDTIISRIKAITPNLEQKSIAPFSYRSSYSGRFEIAGVSGAVCYTIFHIEKCIYLDISVTTNTMAQAVKALEYIQSQVLNAASQKNYIPIISYDAVSEHFCNKTFPLLNALERNLRKLLFNTYIVQFGENYYQTTISEEIQSKAKQRIGSKGAKQTLETKRIQEFFYSLEYGDIETMLFTPHWTEIEETKKRNLLEKHSDLSQLADSELREAILQLKPLSDWERFFSHKSCLVDMQSALGKLRTYRNRVAHAKFFNRSDYNECSKLIKALNKSILEAISLTENNDFAEKHKKALLASFANVIEQMDAFNQWMGERILKTAQALTPTFEKLGKLALYVNQGNIGGDDSSSLLSEHKE